MKYFQKIKGDRIYLSPVNIEDKEIYTKWMNDKEIATNIGCYHKTFSLLSEEKWLQKASNDYHFAIILIENNELIGNVSLRKINPVDQTGELGIIIGQEENRNKGYGKEAIKLILNYGFNTLNLNNVIIKVYSFNKRAINAYNKVGFKKIGTRRESTYKDGKMYDTIYMDMLKREYNDIKDFIFP